MPAVYAGAEDAVIEAAAESVVARARLVLLSLNPRPNATVNSSSGDTASAGSAGGSDSKDKEVVDGCIDDESAAASSPPPPSSPSSSSSTSGAKKLWGLLVKTQGKSKGKPDTSEAPLERSTSDMESTSALGQGLGLGLNAQRPGLPGTLMRQASDPTSDRQRSTLMNKGFNFASLVHEAVATDRLKVDDISF